jgi:acetyl/propionyl-CoA carboxylase alpha subunit
MFKKILIANRGEIAVRILRTCRELGIATLALYEAPDRNSLHVRLADECVLLQSPGGFMDQAAIVAIALEHGAEAIHPGYGFLAEEAGFVRACTAAGIAFIGPPAEVMDSVRNKIAALQRVRAAGFPTVQHSAQSFLPRTLEVLRASAGQLGYPLVVKSCSGGRGRGERLVSAPEQLAEAVRRAQVEARHVYGDERVYLERAILPVHQIGVQVLGDADGNLIHLGEREGSLQSGNQKIVEETPAPSLTIEQRERLWTMAVAIARLFNFQNAGTVEFLLDTAGQFYFTEIKARIQMEHPLTEMVSRVDLVREQIQIAAGQPVTFQQDQIRLEGCAIECRVSAEDPWHHFLASPGHLRRVRLPGGPEVRVDTYVYCGCDVPAQYDPLIAKLIVWGRERAHAVQRTQRALEDFTLIGPPNNLAQLQQILRHPAFERGLYTTDLLSHPLEAGIDGDVARRDLAVAVALLHARRNQAFRPSLPERLTTQWHRDSRRLPQ